MLLGLTRRGNSSRSRVTAAAAEADRGPPATIAAMEESTVVSERVCVGIGTLVAVEGKTRRAGGRMPRASAEWVNVSGKTEAVGWGEGQGEGVVRVRCPAVRGESSGCHRRESVRWNERGDPSTEEIDSQRVLSFFSSQTLTHTHNKHAKVTRLARSLSLRTLMTSACDLLCGQPSA
jgi:hypothetical protein